MFSPKTKRKKKKKKGDGVGGYGCDNYTDGGTPFTMYMYIKSSHIL